MKIKIFYFLAMITSIFFVVGVIFTVFVFNPNITYEGAINSTSSFFGQIHSINFETIPTVINGMTTVTSLIIGFSGAIIGLVYREQLKDDKSVREILYIFFAISIITLFFLLFDNYSLIVGDLEGALRTALLTLIFSICIFSSSLYAVFYKLSNQSNTELGNNYSQMSEHMEKKPCDRNSEEPILKEPEKETEQQEKTLS